MTPFQPSLQVHQGYDVSDYCGVDPLFGIMEQFDELLELAHALGLRVLLDVVPSAGLWRTTTSCAPPPASAAARWVPVGPGQLCWRCWGCPAPPTFTKGRSWDFPRWTFRPKPVWIPCGPAAASPGAAPASR